MIEEVYKKVDDFLQSVKSTDGSLSSYFLTTAGQNAIILMKEHKLIHFRSPNERQSIVDITPKGIEILEYGGIKKYITNKDSKQDLIDNLEFEKLKKEVEKIGYDVKISKFNRITFWIGFAISIIAFFLSIWNFFHPSK